MRFYKLVLSEKRDEFYFEVIYEIFIKAKNRDKAYNKALKIAATFGESDEDMIFWTEGGNAAIWIKTLGEVI